jgi:hypothetical protein
MPKRIAKVAQEYAGRDLQPGDPFDVEPQHVELLLLLDRIEPEEGEPGYVARDMTAGAPEGYRTRDMEKQDDQPRVKRKYTRAA